MKMDSHFKHHFRKILQSSKFLFAALLLICLTAVGCAADDFLQTDDIQEPFQEVAGVIANAEGGLNVRTEPSTSAPCVRRIYNGERVVITEQVVAEDLHWGRISDGWICTHFVAFENEPDEAEYYMVSPSAGAVNVRSEAGISHSFVKRLYGGDVIAVYEQVDVEGRTWGRTDIGWVCMDYLTKSSNSSLPPAQTDSAFDDFLNNI